MTNGIFADKKNNKKIKNKKKERKKHTFQEPHQNFRKINERFELTTLLPSTEWTKTILRTYLTDDSCELLSLVFIVSKRLHFCPRPSGPNDTQNISYGQFLRARFTSRHSYSSIRNVRRFNGNSSTIPQIKKSVLKKKVYKRKKFKQDHHCLHLI
jgi:hypothetical protein